MSSEFDEIIQEFLIESFESLEQMENDLVTLERGEDSESAIASIFRAIHTIKGTCGFFGFTNLELLSQASEDLLALLRGGGLEVSKATIDALLQTHDVTRDLLERIRDTGGDTGIEIGELAAKLGALAKGEAQPAPEPVEVHEPSTDAASAREPATGSMPSKVPEPAVETATLMGDDLAEIVGEFLAESFEALDQMEQDLIKLEKHPDDAETVARIFRTVHSIKGNCGFLGFEKLIRISHLGENLLNLIRSGSATVTRAEADGLLALADAMRSICKNIESDGMEGSVETTFLAQQLEALIATASMEEAAPPGQGTAPAKPASPSPKKKAAKKAVSPEPQSLVKRPSGSETTVRVDVRVLGELMNLAGELVLVRNRLRQMALDSRDSQWHDITASLDVVTTGIQAEVMKTRLQPIRTVWSKFPRIIRDLSSSLGKNIQCVVEGDDTELDRAVMEAIKDPMTHIIRNCVDHGIEAPDVRRAAGKVVQGTVRLHAYHEAGGVVVEITDDGGGIDPHKIRASAVAKGILTKAEADRLSDQDAQHLIFHRGFSTASAVTNVSGRGVGMDVVKSKIEKIGGIVDIHSEVGVGTKLRMCMPLTTAIIPVITVDVAGQVFAIPHVNVVEMVRLGAERMGSLLDKVEGASALRLRGRIMPLIRASDVLGIETESDGIAQVNWLLVLQAGAERFVIIVDAIIDSVELVVQGVDELFADIGVYTGAAILGDGSIALVLDMAGLAAQVHLETSRQIDDEQESLNAATVAGELIKVLLCDLDATEKVTFPLDTVMWLDRVSGSQFDHVGGQTVARIRGETISVFDLAAMRVSTDVSDWVAKRPAQDAEEHVVVVGYDGRRVGLRVHAVLDTMTCVLDPAGADSARASLGCVMVDERFVDVVDIAQLIDRAKGGFIEQLDRSQGRRP